MARLQEDAERLLDTFSDTMTENYQSRMAQKMVRLLVPSLHAIAPVSTRIHFLLPGSKSNPINVDGLQLDTKSCVCLTRTETLPVSPVATDVLWLGSSTCLAPSFRPRCFDPQTPWAHRV